MDGSAGIAGASGAKAPAPRRTQKERREKTIGLLIDATVELLVEVGYSKASIPAICRKACVSQGALFRHFATRQDVMAAAAERVGDGLLQHFQDSFHTALGASDPITLALKLLRENCRCAINQAWFELQIASRTDPQLRETLRPIWLRNFQATQMLARLLMPGLEALNPAMFKVIVDVIVTLFHGEAIDVPLRGDEADDAARFELAVHLCRLLEADQRALHRVAGQ